MFAKVVGSSPTLPTLTTISIYAVILIGESTVRSTIGNLIGILKGKYERKWWIVNILFIIIALCGICGELAQLVEHVIK